MIWMIAIGMQNIQKCWEMHHLLWNKAWFQYDLPKSLCSGVKYGLKMWSGDLSKLKMCSGDRRNVLRRFSPSLKLPQKSPDIRTTISQNMHQYKGGWEQGAPPPQNLKKTGVLLPTFNPIQPGVFWYLKDPGGGRFAPSPWKWYLWVEGFKIELEPCI